MYIEVTALIFLTFGVLSINIWCVIIMLSNIFITKDLIYNFTTVSISYVVYNLL